MDQKLIDRALAEIDTGSLQRLARVAGRLRGTFRSSIDGPCKNNLLHGRGLEFFEYARYAPGHDVRTIDSRASARSGHLLVRRHHDEFSADWRICLDRSASMSVNNGRKWSLSIQLAAAFSYLLLHAGNRVGLFTFSAAVDDICPAGRGHRQYLRVLKFLADCHPDIHGGGSNLVSCFPRLGRETSVVVISDFLAPDDMRGALARIGQQGGELHALQIASISDQLVHTQGPVLLKDIESGESAPFIADQVHLQATARRLADHYERLGRYCARSGIDYSRCTTDFSWRDTVATHLQRSRPNHA